MSNMKDMKEITKLLSENVKYQNNSTEKLNKKRKERYNLISCRFRGNK